jgi:hypothetical protein
LGTSTRLTRRGSCIVRAIACLPFLPALLLLLRVALSCRFEDIGRARAGDAQADVGSGWVSDASRLASRVPSPR